MVDHEALRVCIEFAERVRRELKIRVEKVVLFGSRARDDWVDDSDVDVMIISRDWSGIPFSRRLELLYRMWDYRYDATILAYTPDELEDLARRFAHVREILEHAVIIDVESDRSRRRSHVKP